MVNSTNSILQKAECLHPSCSHERAVIIDSIPEAIMIVDGSGNLSYYNRAALRLMKKFFAVDLRRGSYFLNYLPEYRHDHFLSKMEQVRNGYKLEYEVRYKDGNWLSIVLTPLHSNRWSREICMFVRDITCRKNMEVKLRKYESRYHRVMDSLGREQTQQDLTHYQKLIAKAYMAGHEQERNQIGRELHDNIQQILAAIKLQASYLASSHPGCASEMDLLLANINYAISEVRSYSRGLVTPKFREKELIPEVKSLLDSLKLSHKSQIITSGFEEEKLNADFKLVVFRIIQEQLTNIVKYSCAGRVELKLEIYSQEVKLEINDNGVGFDPDQRKAGIGLRNIRDRVELLEGQFRIISSPGQGCTLEVRLPLNRL